MGFSGWMAIGVLACSGIVLSSCSDDPSSIALDPSSNTAGVSFVRTQALPLASVARCRTPVLQTELDIVCEGVPDGVTGTQGFNLFIDPDGGTVSFDLLASVQGEEFSVIFSGDSRILGPVGVAGLVFTYFCDAPGGCVETSFEYFFENIDSETGERIASNTFTVVIPDTTRARATAAEVGLARVEISPRQVSPAELEALQAAAK